MSDMPTSFRPFARMGFGGRAASHFRGTIQTDNQNQTGRTVVSRGQVGTVIFRSPGVTINYAISGVTRDSSGSILGNCRIELFISGSEINVKETISDASGNFRFDNPGTGPFYIVAYKTGSPDVAGTTVQTLTAV